MSFNIESVVCLAYCMYSLSCGILVDKLVTSRDSSIALSGTLVLSMKLMESVVLYQSFRYDFCCCAKGWSSMARNADNFSVGPETPEVFQLSRFVDFRKGIKYWNSRWVWS